MKSLSECRLYTFVDTAYLQGRSAALVAAQLCEGGSDIIQLRAKSESQDEIRRLAEAVLPITRQAGVPLVVNDYPAIARAIGVEFCHLGQEDFFDRGLTHVSQVWQNSEFRVDAASDNARRPPEGGTQSYGPLIGLSTHAPEQAERALQAEPAYIAIGPVYVTGTKPAAQPVTLEYVKWAAARVAIPWFAIGGINLVNLPEILAAGAKRICVVSAILNAPDITQACRQFKMGLANG